MNKSKMPLIIVGILVIAAIVAAVFVFAGDDDETTTPDSETTNGQTQDQDGDENQSQSENTDEDEDQNNDGSQEDGSVGELRQTGLDLIADMRIFADEFEAAVDDCDAPEIERLMEVLETDIGSRFESFAAETEGRASLEDLIGTMQELESRVNASIEKSVGSCVAGTDN